MSTIKNDNLKPMSCFMCLSLFSLFARLKFLEFNSCLNDLVHDLFAKSNINCVWSNSVNKPVLVARRNFLCQVCLP